MNPQKMAKGGNNNNNNFARKPRRSIKVEGNYLNNSLREGLAKVIDASKLGKRLSSEIWNSFGAIQVEDNFTYPSIDTKTVADGASTLRICQFFVACSKCFSVFKYDGHAYGTTGLVKHVKICQGTNQRVITASSTNNNPIEQKQQQLTIEIAHTSSVPNTTTTTTTTSTNGTRRKREPTAASRARAQPSLRYLAKAIEELKCEQIELKQKINEMLNILSNTGFIGQIQVVEDLQHKSD